MIMILFPNDLSFVLPEEVRVATSIQQDKDNLLFVDFPYEQPVRADVTLPLASAVSCEYVGMILFFKLLTIQKLPHNRP